MLIFSKELCRKPARARYGIFCEFIVWTKSLLYYFRIVYNTVLYSNIIYRELIKFHYLGLGHETIVYTVRLSIFLWMCDCDMAGLLRGTFVSLWYLPRIWPSFTDMQHYCHARYPTDDWHLAYMFSLVYFYFEVCLEGVFAHSVSTRQDPRQRLCTPHATHPFTRKKSNRGSLGSPLEQVKGHLNRRMGLPALLGGSGVPDSLISNFIAQFMGCVIDNTFGSQGRILF